jgi:hypothetical protein
VFGGAKWREGRKKTRGKNGKNVGLELN